MESASSSYTLRAPARRVRIPTRAGSGGEAGEGDSEVLLLDGHSHQLIIERDHSGAGVRVRRAAKLELAGTWLLRVLLCYGAAVLVGYSIIWALNGLLKYVMAVFIPLLGRQSTLPLAFFTITVLPALCTFFATICATALGVLLDIWNDFDWIHVSPMPLPPVIRQWLVFCMILLVPLITFMVATFISGVDAYTAALLSELVSLLLLLVIYFISVTVAQVRICWDVMNDGGGKWDTMQRVLWLSVESHGAVWIPRCCPIPATFDSTHPLQRNEDGQSSAESAMAGCPSMTRNPSYGANGVVTAGDAHNDSQGSCCAGMWHVEEKWAVDALDVDSRAIIRADHTQVFHLSCCFSSRAQMQQRGVSAFVALVLVAALLIVSALGGALNSPNGSSAARVLAAVAVAVLIIVGCLGTAFRRSWPKNWSRAEDGEDLGAFVDVQKPSRRTLVPSKCVLVVWYVIRLLVLVLVPIIVFIVFAAKSGSWTFMWIVVAACAFTALTTVFDVKMVLQHLGPSAMLKLEGISWDSARQAYLILTRMNVKSARTGFVLFLWVMALLFMLISLSGIEQPPSTYKGVPYTNDSTVAPNPFGQQYPACNLEQPIPGLTVLDYAFLSDVAYIHNATQAKSQVEAYFGEGGLLSNYTYIQTERAASSFYRSTFGFNYIFQVPDTQSYVIAIRGTSTLLDLIADVNLWMEVSLIQFLRAVLPLGVMWDPAYPYMISMLNVDHGNEAFEYHNDIEEQVRILLQKPGSKVVLTGHSLGGGLGTIAAASTGVPAIVFSAPNAIMSRFKFDITMATLDVWPYSIIPKHDPVAMIDKPGILNQGIECSSDGMACHELGRTQCELQSTCGSGGRPAIEPEFCYGLGFSNITLVPNP